MPELSLPDCEGHIEEVYAEAVGGLQSSCGPTLAELRGQVRLIDLCLLQSQERWVHAEYHDQLLELEGVSCYYLSGEVSLSFEGHAKGSHLRYLRH